jgi:hypothetical protein
MTDWNAQVIEEFRANGGKVGGMFEGRPLLLLHHVGARSGTARVAPLVYLPDGDRYVVFASKAGAPENPGCWLTLTRRSKWELRPWRCAPSRRPANSATTCMPRRWPYNRNSASTPRTRRGRSR